MSQSSLTFYRQARQDGGIRTGIEIGGESALGRFEGGDDSDPVLTWWVVVDCRGEGLPDRPEPARRWFLNHAGPIRAALLDLAETLGAGLDFNSWPYRSSPRVVEASGEDALITITCHANRRYHGQHFADQLREIAEHWEERVRSLPELQEIAM